MNSFFGPITMKMANDFVRTFHRHSKPVLGCKFVLGLFDSDELVGVSIVGRPVSRIMDDGLTAEILRVCVLEGHPNACSRLYSRSKRIAQLMGYQRVITYTLMSESASSLKAVGASVTRYTRAECWTRRARPRVHQKVYEQAKIRWTL